MEFLELLLASYKQEVLEKQNTLEHLMNMPGLTRFEDVKYALKEIALIKIAIAELVGMMTSENKE